LRLRYGERGQDKCFDHLFQLWRLAFGPCCLKKLEALGIERVAVASVDLEKRAFFAAEIVTVLCP
jgi:hypothetical protein